jgi:hypothetical protein
MSDPFVDPTGFPYPSPEALDEIRERHLHQLQGEGVTGDPDWQSKQPDRLYEDNPDSPISAPTDRAATTLQTGDVLYAWQMQVENGWNIVGLTLQGGMTLPLVTTSMAMAWEAFEVAQAHANRNACQVRLATFRFDSLAAVVEPND